MPGRERFGYRRELVPKPRMLSGPIIDMTQFETMRSDGENGDRTIAVVRAD